MRAYPKLCGRCKYFFQYAKDAVSGECRRHAPKSDGNFPQVFKIGWCGDWEFNYNRHEDFSKDYDVDDDGNWHRNHN